MRLEKEVEVESILQMRLNFSSKLLVILSRDGVLRVMELKNYVVRKGIDLGSVGALSFVFRKRGSVIVSSKKVGLIEVNLVSGKKRSWGSLLFTKVLEMIWF